MYSLTMHMTSGDVAFEGNTIDELREKIKEKFPKWGDEVVDRWVSKAEKTEKTFSPDTRWMERKYNEFNDSLFEGRLGRCNFMLFTKNDNTFGRFSMKAKHLLISRADRHIYIDGLYRRTTINSSNFDLTIPTIGLNADYSGKEQAFENTLIHEMCHYYTYMNGYAPKQAHGREFKIIASVIYSKSNGKYKVETYATDFEVANYKESDEIKARKETRRNNRIENGYAVFVVTKKGTVELTMTTSQKLVMDILNYQKYSGGYSSAVYVSRDSKLIEKLMDKGYRRFMRTYKFWTLSDSSIVNELGTKYEAIKHVMDKDMKNESRVLDMIISENIERFLNEEFGGTDDAIAVNPEDNLSLESPFEKEIG